MAPMRLLVAEDDGALARFIAKGFSAERNTVDIVPDGIQAKSFAMHGDYDLLILDLNLFLFVGEYLDLRAGLDDRLFSFFQKTEWSKQDHQRDSRAGFVIA